jgi:hypothetical protein
MTSLEQTAIAMLLMVGAILITLAYPHEPDLSASTRAMLRGGFEGRTVMLPSTMPIVATADLLRRTSL